MNCEKCGKQWLHGTCETTPARRARCATEEMNRKSEARNRVYLDLKGSRERLCRAQTNVPEYWREELGWALDIIDRVGSSVCPDEWSMHDQPEYPEAKR